MAKDKWLLLLKLIRYLDLISRRCIISDMPVLWDERRTTVDAHRILFEGGKNAKKRKKTVDAVAASLILEGYLDFRRMQNR
mgnify:CR=1 FL=1